MEILGQPEDSTIESVVIKTAKITKKESFHKTRKKKRANNGYFF